MKGMKAFSERVVNQNNCTIDNGCTRLSCSVQFPSN